ncbi:tRNA (guanine-N7-)-methyltransferase [Emydomyces testavorans]|uniref:tRNA (Guanine-N7-)-methyltransferase n=1 Tax=Emydomyces testavorans TaxID=2070801 RepID=A0AAF0DM84_9EURO|nr:tRNA (guanine-N7-)-methyltransferase [Emydomyces testavorans]
MTVFDTIAVFLGIIAISSIFIAIGAICGITTAAMAVLVQVNPRIRAFLGGRPDFEEARLEAGLASDGDRVSHQDARVAHIETARLNWSTAYPAFARGKKLTKKVEIVACGKGLGPSMIKLAPLLQESVMAVFDSCPIAVGETNSRIAKLRDQFARSGNATAGCPYQNISAFLVTQHTATPTYFSSNQLSRVFFSVPSQQSTSEKNTGVSDTARKYAPVVQSGGTFCALAESEDVLQQLTRDFDAAGHLWCRVPENEWKQDSVMTVIADRTREGVSSETRIAVWRRK